MSQEDRYKNSNVSFVEGGVIPFVPNKVLSAIKPGHAVKKIFTSPNNDTERMWVDVESVSEDGVTGRLASIPTFEVFRDLDEVSIKFSEIIDVGGWELGTGEFISYQKDGRIPDPGSTNEEVFKSLLEDDDGLDNLLDRFDQGLVGEDLVATVISENEGKAREQATPQGMSVIAEVFKVAAIAECQEGLVENIFRGKVFETVGFNRTFGEKAYEWALLAANHGDTKSWSVAAGLVMMGYSESQQGLSAFAAALFQKGIEQGSLASQVFYGVHLLEGWGIEKDPDKAKGLFEAALANDAPTDENIDIDRLYEIARNNLESLPASTSGPDVKEAVKENRASVHHKKQTQSGVNIESATNEVISDGETEGSSLSLPGIALVGTLILLFLAASVML